MPLSEHNQSGEFNCRKEAENLLKTTAIETREKIKNADLIIITQEWSDGWENRKNGLFTAGLADLSLLKSGDFIYRQTSFTDCLKDTEKAVDIIRQTNQCPVLVGTGPIPIYLTVSEEDARIVNLRNKSILNIVHHQIYESCPNVFKFPCYEMSLFPESDISPFREDGRHPSVELINYLMAELIRNLGT